MKRVITSLKNVNKDVLNLLLTEYPNGIDDAEFVNFPTSNGSFIKALELQMEDCLYLIKMDDEDYYQKFHSKDSDDSEEEDNESEDSDDSVEEVTDIEE